jgi:hypothetical protein
VVASSKLNKVLIDGGSGLNVLFTKTLKKMKLDITHMLTKSNTPFYGIVPGNAAIPLGSVVLLVTFGESRDNYRTEYIKFEVANFETSYHAILGRSAIAKFMAVPHYTYLVLKMPSPAGVLSLQGDLKPRLRHKSRGDRLYKSSTQRYDGGLRCVEEACYKRTRHPGNV